MAKFSERYGYTKVSDVIIREEMPKRVANGLCNVLLPYIDHDIDCAIKADFLGEVLEYEDPFDMYIDKEYVTAKKHFTSELVSWFEKLNLLEFILERINENDENRIGCKNSQVESIINDVNALFEKNNYAYRILEDKITEITSNEEIREIEESLTNPLDGVRTHIDTALKFISSAQKEPDYRNSIKESISAVEVCCREITGENDLGKALSKLEAKGVVINSQIKKGFENLYHYTNDKKTGIRHALMDDVNEPTSDEAIFMLVTCSAFVNYLTKKNKQ